MLWTAAGKMCQMWFPVGGGSAPVDAIQEYHTTKDEGDPLSRFMAA